MLFPVAPQTARALTEQSSGLGTPMSGRDLLSEYGFRTHRETPPEQLAQFVQRFAAAWPSSSASPAPEPAAVLDMLAGRDRMLERAWTQYFPGDYPAVHIASIVGYANPLVVSAPRMKPLIIMSEGLPAFVFGVILTAILYAHEEHDPDECLAVMRQFMLAWLTDDPALQPEGATIRRLSTINQDTTTFAVGLSNCAFTWAFYHEVGHVRLGHLSDSVNVAHMSANGQVRVESKSYLHDEELQADWFGFNRYLELLGHEAELRKDLEIGKQGDHAPIITMELMDFAYALYPQYDRRICQSHPTPLTRAAHMRTAVEAHLSSDGRSFYEWWSDMLAHVREGLPAPQPPTQQHR